MSVDVIGDDPRSLKQEAARVSAEIDGVFNEYLADCGDGRDQLCAAIRHAALGGGKRLRPLATVSDKPLELAPAQQERPFTSTR